MCDLTLGEDLLDGADGWQLSEVPMSHEKTGSADWFPFGFHA